MEIAVVLAGLSLILAVLTLVEREWVELFGVDPDGGSGAIEWLLAGAFALIALAFSFWRRSLWLRLRSQAVSREH